MGQRIQSKLYDKKEFVLNIIIGVKLNDLI